VYVTNTVDILNQLAFDLITGENVADDNLGDVVIKTGDIALITQVQTEINRTYINQKCDECEPEVEPEEPPSDEGDPDIIPDDVYLPPSPPDDKPEDKDDSDDEDNDDEGEVLGIGGAILPATGTLDTLLMLLASIAFLLLGSYLRLRSGRSPSLV
jgi:hypothetical protein